MLMRIVMISNHISTWFVFVLLAINILLIIIDKTDELKKFNFVRLLLICDIVISVLTTIVLKLLAW